MDRIFLGKRDTANTLNISVRSTRESSSNTRDSSTPNRKAGTF